MMKLMVLSISIHPCNTFGFPTSGSKFDSHFRNLNLLKEPYLSQNLLDVDDTLQLFASCLNKQKVSGDVLLSPIIFEIQFLENEGE